MSAQEVNQNPGTSNSSGNSSSSAAAYIIGALVIIALGAGLWWYFGMGGSMNDDAANMNDDTASETENTFTTDYPDVVARVNGAEITGEQLSTNVTQTAQTAQLQGLDPNSADVRAQIEEQAITSLVNTELLLQAATEAGVTASDEDVDAQFAELTTQLGGEEALEEQLNTAGITRDELRADIRQQIILNTYLENNTDVANLEVTQEEMQEFYDSVAAQNEGQEVPPLAEVEAQIRQQLLNQKQQAAINQVITDLRADADIEILI